MNWKRYTANKQTPSRSIQFDNQRWGGFIILHLSCTLRFIKVRTVIYGLSVIPNICTPWCRFNFVYLCFFLFVIWWYVLGSSRARTWWIPLRCSAQSYFVHLESGPAMSDQYLSPSVSFRSVTQIQVCQCHLRLDMHSMLYKPASGLSAVELGMEGWGWGMHWPCISPVLQAPTYYSKRKIWTKLVVTLNAMKKKILWLWS